MVTPLTVTVGWLRHYLDCKAAGLDETAARRSASEAEGIKGKAYAHCRIKTGELRVPVSGGAGALKRRGASPQLSEHGKWRREHTGAWNAAYGRTPYYEHLMPQLEAVYATSEGESLESFNSRMLETALRWLDQESVAAARAPEMEGKRNEIKAKADESLSIFDLLFRLGKEGVFAL